jgi:uncharacterized protein
LGGATVSLRDQLQASLKDAMKAKQERKVSTLRMAMAAIKNKDIELRTSAAPASDDVMVMDVLTKLVKQRRESVDMFEKGGRLELAAGEREEIEILEAFLPKTMSEAEADVAIRALVAELGAASVKDMGKVMGALKERFTGQIDMSSANKLVKAALGG